MPRRRSVEAGPFDCFSKDFKRACINASTPALTAGKEGGMAESDPAKRERTGARPRGAGFAAIRARTRGRAYVPENPSSRRMRP